MSEERVVFSVIAPIYNEIESINEFYNRIRLVLEQLQQPWELILVDDGSVDGSTERILALAEEDERVLPVIFARNFGHQIAVTAGLDASSGDAVVIIDSDLQDPPEVIPDLIARWREGYEVVYAVRSEREGESWFKLITAGLFYRLITRMTEVDIPLDTGDFRLLDREVVDVMGTMRERYRFLRGMTSWVGFRQAGVSYKRAARFAGSTKYPFKKMVRLALNAVTGFSFVPLQMITYGGVIVTVISVLLWLVDLLLVLGVQGIPEILQPGLIGLFFLGGVQLISIGILGEYIGRLYDEARGRPLYIVRKNKTQIEHNEE
ncbi:MAG: glycosyltransferase family 2 protein [Anaerolineales bacterium]|nr:glycosyltransferase family 2 protein [Anaerolineales bacterium]